MSTTGTAIVTGGSQGIGAGLVTRFLEKGYNVVGNSRAISDSTYLTPSPQLALVDGEKHGYAILKEVTEQTQGEVRLSTGTLYGIIKRLLAEGLIAECRFNALSVF